MTGQCPMMRMMSMMNQCASMMGEQQMGQMFNQCQAMMGSNPTASSPERKEKATGNSLSET